MGRGSLADEGVVVARASGCDGVEHLDDALLGDEDGTGSQGLVLDGVPLEVAEADDTAGQDGPEFLLLKLPLLRVPLGDLVIERPLSELEEGIYLVEGGAILILGLGDDLLERDDILASD